MKHMLLFLFLIVGAAFAEKPTPNHPVEYVYICTGNYAACYHKTNKCEGLDYCSKEIKNVTIDSAKHVYHRKPCNFCYNNE